MDEVIFELEEIARCEEGMIEDITDPAVWDGKQPSPQASRAMGIYHIGYLDGLRAALALLNTVHSA